MKLSLLMPPQWEYSSSSGFFDSDCSDNSSEITLSRSTSTERLKLAEEGCIEETFRVDRRKLESMILGCPPDPWEREITKFPIDKNGRIKSAAEFFQEIMDTTDTIIKYPKNLKLKSRNKRDPPVRVIGLPTDIMDAASLIYVDLYPENRVTLKIDIPWTSHSLIIGKGGQAIQPLVKRTGVSVHFPDGNKNSDISKSNQVSINSRGEGVMGLEEARSALRNVSPLTFSFYFPTNVQFLCIQNPHDLLQNIRYLYDVQADLYLTERESVLYGFVKGKYSDADRVQEATFFLLQGLCGKLASHISVQTTLEISSQFHGYILGKGQENLRRITHLTSTIISFPDAANPSLSKLDKSTVVISGSITNVFLARDKIIGSIPVQLIFEICCDDNVQEAICEVRRSLGVEIVVKRKADNYRQTILIKVAERRVAMLYEAWHRITQSNAPFPNVKIPLSYYIDYPYSSYLYSWKDVIDFNVVSMLFSPPEENKMKASSPLPFLEQHSPEVVHLKEPPAHDHSCSAIDESVTDLLLNSDRRAPGFEKSNGIISKYVSKKLQAERALKEPITPVPRVPTSQWAGYGLSSTAPVQLLSTMVSEISKNKVNFSTYGVSQYYEPGSFHTSIPLPSSLSPCSNDGNMLDDRVKQCLIYLQLEQYCDILEFHDISFNTFCTLSDEDLLKMGITSYSHRRKLIMAIKNIQMTLNNEEF